MSKLEPEVKRELVTGWRELRDNHSLPVALLWTVIAIPLSLMRGVVR